MYLVIEVIEEDLTSSGAANIFFVISKIPCAEFGRDPTQKNLEFNISSGVAKMERQIFFVQFGRDLTIFVIELKMAKFANFVHLFLKKVQSWTKIFFFFRSKYICTRRTHYHHQNLILGILS